MTKQKIVINPRTIEEMTLLMEIYKGKGWKEINRVKSKDLIKAWYTYEKEMCVVLGDKFSYGYIDFYKSEGYKIITFQKFINMELKPKKEVCKCCGKELD